MKDGVFLCYFGGMVKSETNQRLNNEIILAGGERSLLHLPVEDRSLWDTQAIVLSYIREHANVHKAALQGGRSIEEIDEWVANNVLGFTDRKAAAFASLGHTIKESLIEDIRNGKQKNPTIILSILKVLLPNEFDRSGRSVNEDTKEMMDQVRRMNQEHVEIRARMDAKEKAEQEAVANQPPAEDPFSQMIAIRNMNN